jgi:hypothetical protein
VGFLLECSSDIVEVWGHFMSGDADGNPHHCREVLILERQRQLLCVIRGTFAEQQGKFTKHLSIVELPENVKVFADRQAALGSLEQRTFALLDQLTEEVPFCDVCFAGHSFGAALATLAAYRYASARPELRVAALVTASSKVGMEDFRMSVNSLPNLKAFRVELACESSGCGSHVGHSIRIQPPKVKAYKFGESTSHHEYVRSLFHKRDRDVSDFVAALEDLPKWVQDYHRNSGAGVRGNDNEERQLV